MKKLLLLTTVIILAIVILSLFQHPKQNSNNKTSDKPTIKIGAILPLQGAYSIYGEAGKKSLMMFEEDLKKRNLKNNYDIIIEPCDANELKSPVNAARKSVLTDKVNAIITVWNNAGVATTDIVKGRDLIHINLGNDSRTTIEKNNFNFGPSTEGQVNLSLQEMTKLGVKKLTVIGINNAWSTSMLEEYKKQIPNYNIELTDVIIINSGEKNFRTTLANIASKTPDMISIVLENPETDIFRKQMLEKNINIPITSIESTEYTEQPEIYEGTWYINYPDGTPDFLSRFKTYSSMTTFPTVAYVYDMASILVDAFEHSNTTDEAIKYLQSQTTFNGATGEIKQENNFFKTKDVIKEVKENKLIFREKL